MKIGKMNRVKEVSETSTFSELTLFLFTSFQEKERIHVQEILSKREKGLKDEMKNFKQVLEKNVEVLENKVKEEGGFASMEKQKVENLRKSLMELEVKMKEQRDVFEKEGNLKENMYEDEMKRLKNNYEKKLKIESDFCDVEKKKVENLINGRVEFEGKVKEECEILKKEGCLREKMYEDELKKVRDNYAKELKRERGLMEKKVSLVKFEKREVEEKMGRQCEMFENERETMQKNLKAELKKLREYHKKDLEREIDFMGKKLSCAALEKLILEEEVRKSRMEFEEKMKEYHDMVKVVREERDVMENTLKAEFEEKMKGCRDMVKELKEERVIMENNLKAELVKSRENLKVELEKLRDNYEALKRERVMSEDKLILAELEIMHFVVGLRSIRMEFEEKLKEHCDVLEKESHSKQTMFEDELNKLRGNYKKELEHERDMSENKLVLADLEKMDLVEELSKSRTDFEQTLEALEGENRDLHKELEFYQGTFCSIMDSVKHIERVSNSAISGNVRANGYLSNCSSAGDVSMCKSSGKASNGEGRLIKSHIPFGEPSSKTPSQTERKKGSQGELIGVQLGEESGGSFLENEPEDGSYNENNLRCKRRRIDESKDDKEAAEFQTGKEITWRNSADMLSAFTSDPELCMAGVVALYRRHIFSGNPSNILTAVDISSATAVARYLVNDDPANKMNRSLLEAQQDCPYVLQTCQRLAIKYKEQLLEIYQKEMDPLFSSKS